MGILEDQISYMMVLREDHRVLGFGWHGCSTEPFSKAKDSLFKLRIQSEDSTTLLDGVLSQKSRYLFLEATLLTIANNVHLSLSQIICSQVSLFETPFVAQHFSVHPLWITVQSIFFSFLTGSPGFP